MTSYATRPIDNLAYFYRHREFYQPDPRPRLRRRPLVWRRRDHQRRRPREKHRQLGMRPAFAPDEGERLGDVESTSKDSVLNSALVPLKYPTGEGAGTAVEFAIDPATFRDAFAADLPTTQTALMAATQRPIAEAAFSEPSGPAAWKTLPSRAVVAVGDEAAGTDVIRSMAQRAKATITEVEGSHVIMISQPQIVTDVILSAIAAVAPGVGARAR